MRNVERTRRGSKEGVVVVIIGIIIVILSVSHWLCFICIRDGIKNTVKLLLYLEDKNLLS
jgi:hypothetical protein